MKTEESKCCGSSHKEMVVDEVHKMGKNLSGMAKKAKAKYDQADPKTKKAVIAGVAGAAALVAGAIGYHKMKKGKK